MIMQLHSIGLNITYTAYSSQPKHNIINTQNYNAKKHTIIKNISGHSNQQNLYDA